MDNLTINVIEENIELTDIRRNRAFKLNTILSNASIFVLFMLMLCSMYPWFVWQNRALVTPVLCLAFLVLRFCVLRDFKITFSKLGIIFLGFLFFSAIVLSHFEIITAYKNIRYMLVLTFVIMMQNEEKKKIVTLTTTIYAWILCVSIILYILIVFCTIELPHSIVEYKNVITDYPNYRNYIFLLIPDEYRMFYRFQSIFTEPGHLGMISSLLIYINRYDLKKKSVFIIFVSALLSFSLAAYVLLIIGYFIYELVSRKKKIYIKLMNFIMSISLLIGMASYIYIQYSDSLISQLIISRLEYDEDRGFTGNNRANSYFTYYYETKFYKSSDYMFGMNPDQYEKKLAGGVSSYKSFIVQHGLIGIILLFIFYSSIVYDSKSKLLFGLFILYCASFWQRPYALWEMELFLFIGAAEMFRINTDDLSVSKQIYKTN